MWKILNFTVEQRNHKLDEEDLVKIGLYSLREISLQLKSRVIQTAFILRKVGCHYWTTFLAAVVLSLAKDEVEEQ